MLRRTPRPSGPPLVRYLMGPLGQPGRVALSCGLTGAVVLGGVAVALLVLLSRVSASSVVPLVGVFSVLGAFVAFMHGAALGLIGRDGDVHWSEAFESIGVAAVLCVPLMIFAGLVALWIAFTPVALSLGLADPIWIFVLGGWVCGLLLFAWATSEVFGAAAHAITHWPDRRLGTPLVASTFLILLVAFVLTRPEIWFTDLEVNTAGAVVLAVVATVWIGLPVEVLALRLMHRDRGH